MKSVKSINPCKSVIPAIYDMAKAPGGVPMTLPAGRYRYERGNKGKEGAEFIIKLPE